MVTSVGRCLLLGVVAITAGCSDVHETPDAPPEGPPAYVGVWHATGGDLLSGSTGKAQYIELTAEGTGALRTSYEPYGVLGCGLELFHVDIGGGLVSIDFGGGGARLLRYELPDADHLVLADQVSRQLMFERVDDVPASAKCREVTPAATTTDVRPAAGYWSGLAFQSSTSLWYADDTYALHSVNPGTGVVTPANVNTAGYQWIQTFDGSSYWAHCACGRNETMQLLAPGGTTVTETLDTAALGDEIGIYGVALDASALWVVGVSYDSNSYRLLKVTGATGARTLADAFDFAPTRSIAVLDGKLWGLSETGLGTVLVDIDTVTKKAAATYELPPNASWKQISAGAGSLWVFGTEQDGDGQLLRITP